MTHVVEPIRYSDRDLIAELKRRGYYIVKRDRMQYLQINHIVDEQSWVHGPQDAIAEHLTQACHHSLGHEIAKYAPVKEHDNPDWRGGGKLFECTICIIKPREKTNGEEGKARTQGEGAGQKEDQQSR